VHSFICSVDLHLPLTFGGQVTEHNVGHLKISLWKWWMGWCSLPSNWRVDTPNFTTLVNPSVF